MCGLVYVNRKDGRSAVKSVKKRYRKQKYRGQEGFGYVAIKDNKVVSYQRAPTEHEIMQMLDKETAPEILFHHRFPTSTPNMEEQAHPLHVKNDIFEFEYFVAHNGVIRNPFLRKQEHDKLKIPYTTELRPFWKATSGKSYYADGALKFNDSEALAIDTALVLEGKVRGIESEGSAAVIALKIKDGMVIDRIFYHNSGNPLKIDDTKHMVTVASQGHGQELYTTYFAHLTDYKLEIMPERIFTPTAYRSYHHAGSSIYSDGTPKYNELDNGYSRGEDDFNFDYSGIETVQQNLLLPPKGNGLSETTLRAMTRDDLWEEYDKTLGVIHDLKKGIEAIDSKVLLKEFTSDEAFTNLTKGRLRLRTTLDKVTAQNTQLDTEITRRIVLVKPIT